VKRFLWLWIVTIAVGLSVDMAPAGESPMWFGEYAGSEIPGYVIERSGLETAYVADAPTSDVDFATLGLALRAMGQKKNGVGLVNSSPPVIVGAFQSL
jgi:hypothetical protein